MLFFQLIGGTCVDVCMCNCLHQKEKTAVEAPESKIYSNEVFLVWSQKLFQSTKNNQVKTLPVKQISCLEFLGKLMKAVTTWHDQAIWNYNSVHQVYQLHQNILISPYDELLNSMTNTLADGLIHRTSSMSDINQSLWWTFKVYDKYTLADWLIHRTSSMPDDKA